MRSTNKKFDYTNKKWGITPINNFYTKFQGLELKFFLKDTSVLQQNKSNKVLDLGCGGGNIPGFFKEKFPRWEVWGVDFAQDAIDLGKRAFPEVKFLKEDVKKLPFKSNSFDLITGFDSLEHFTSLDSVLKEVSRVLKKNGTFYVAIPLEKQFPSIYWILYKLGWRGKREFAGHINFFNNREFIELLKLHGFVLIKKRYSYHMLFSVLDIAYYLSQTVMGRRATSFESSLEELKPGVKKSLITGLKNVLTAVHFFESSLLYWFPGGKGHYVFLNKKTEDFFSTHPPITVLEEQQVKMGLEKILRPKDLEFINLLDENSFRESRKILDFGCANGIWLERVLAYNTKASGVGIDISKSLIEYANSRNLKRGSYLCNSDKWPKHSSSFDYCISLDVFEHVEEKEAEVKEIYNRMQKGGKFIFYTLNPDNKYTFDWLFEEFGSDYLYKRADHEKKNFISPVDFKKILESNGFRNVKYVLYAGPANLFWDVASYIYLSPFGKVLDFMHFGNLITSVIDVNDKFLRLIFPLNNFIDGFFFKKGHSNGYFIWGEK